MTEIETQIGPDIGPQPPLPVPGQEPWGDALNDCVVWLYEYVVANDDRITVNESRIMSLETRVMTLEKASSHLVVQTFSYQFSDQAPPPTGSQVRLDNTDPTLATNVVIRNIDNLGQDNSTWFSTIKAGSVLRLGDWDDSATFVKYDITGLAMVSASDTTIPVTHSNSSGSLPNAKCMVVLGVMVTL